MAAADVFAWVKLFAPIILSQIPATKKLAAPVAQAIPEAEALFGPGDGAKKLEHAVNLGVAVAQVQNQLNPSHAVDPQDVAAGVRDGINTAFDVAKVVAAAHGAPAGAQPVVLPA